MSQSDELSRVTNKIAPAVLKFVAQRWTRMTGENRTFFASELVAFVKAQIKTAPASPDRILRALRQEGHFDYDVDRTNSEYTLLTGVFDPPKPAAIRPRKKSHVTIRVWFVDGFVDGREAIDGPYLTEEEANKQNACFYDDEGTIKEEMRKAIRA